MFRKIFSSAVMVSLVGMVFLTGCSTTKPYARERQYEKVRSMLEDREFSDAADYATKKLEAGDDWRLLFYRAFAFYHLDDYDNARADFDRALALEDAYPLLYVNRGNLNARLGAYDEALADYAAAVTAFDAKDREQILGGVIFQKKDITGETLDFTIDSRAVEGAYGKAFAYYNSGLVYEKKKDLESARAAYNQSLDCDATFVPSLYARGVVALRLGTYDAAAADFTAALGEAPAYASIWCMRGEAYRALGKNEDAVRDYSEALVRNPEFGRAYYCRGLAYEALGEEARAVADFQCAERLGFDPAREQFLKSEPITS